MGRCIGFIGCEWKERVSDGMCVVKVRGTMESYTELFVGSVPSITRARTGVGGVGAHSVVNDGGRRQREMCIRGG